MKSFTRLALVAACSVALYTVACGGKADAPPAAVDPAPAKAEAPAEAEAPAKAEADKGEAPKKLAEARSGPQGQHHLAPPNLHLPLHPLL